VAQCQPRVFAEFRENVDITLIGEAAPSPVSASFFYQVCDVGRTQSRRQICRSPSPQLLFRSNANIQGRLGSVGIPRLISAGQDRDGPA